MSGQESDVTVVYYTSNTENKRFQSNICQAIAKAKGDLPLVSVSQEPMDFGLNICVGKVGASSQNAYRQLLLGARVARTRFVCIAEDDCVYPPEYFRFVPPDDQCAYLASPLWILFCQRGKSKVFGLKPRGSESSMVINRELLMDRISTILSGLDYWGPMMANGEGWPYLLDRKAIRSVRFEAPVVTFKTDQQMNRRTPWDMETKTRELQPWGTAIDMIKKFL
uniref:Glycosyltransferase n=1 Tax=viral metagenome TaxID=1070528 RepID=A0A6M3LHM9_9ZZZZ